MATAVWARFADGTNVCSRGTCRGGRSRRRDRRHSDTGDERRRSRPGGRCLRQRGRGRLPRVRGRRLRVKAAARPSGGSFGAPPRSRPRPTERAAEGGDRPCRSRHRGVLPVHRAGTDRPHPAPGGRDVRRGPGRSRRPAEQTSLAPGLAADGEGNVLGRLGVRRAVEREPVDGAGERVRRGGADAQRRRGAEHRHDRPGHRHGRRRDGPLVAHVAELGLRRRRDGAGRRRRARVRRAGRVRRRRSPRPTRPATRAPRRDSMLVTPAAAPRRASRRSITRPRSGHVGRARASGSSCSGSRSRACPRAARSSCAAARPRARARECPFERRIARSDATARSRSSRRSRRRRWSARSSAASAPASASSCGSPRRASSARSSATTSRRAGSPAASELCLPDGAKKARKRC